MLTLLLMTSTSCYEFIKPKASADKNFSTYAMDSAAVYWGSKIVALTNKIVKGEIRNFDIFPALQCVRKYSYFLLVIV